MQAVQSTVRGLVQDIGNDLGVAVGAEGSGPLGLGEDVDLAELASDPDAVLSKLIEGGTVGPNITSISGIDPDTGEPVAPAAGQPIDPATGLPSVAQTAGAPEASIEALNDLESLDPTSIQTLLDQLGLGSVVDQINLEVQVARIQDALFALFMKLLIIALVVTIAFSWGLAAAIRGAAGVDASFVGSIVQGLVAVPWQTSQVGWAYMPLVLVQLVPALGLLINPYVGLVLLALTSVAMIPLLIRGSCIAAPAAVRASLGERSWRPASAKRGYQSQRLTVAGVVLGTGVVLFVAQLPSIAGPQWSILIAPALLFAVGAWVSLDQQVILPGGLSAAEMRLVSNTRQQVNVEMAGSDELLELATVGTSEHGEWVYVPVGRVTARVSWSGPAAPQIWTCDPAGTWTQHHYADSGGTFALLTHDSRVYIAARGLADAGVTTVRVEWWGTAAQVA